MSVSSEPLGPCNWHSTISIEFREHLVKSAIPALYRTTENQFNENLPQVYDLAEWVENHSFITAVSSSDYHRLLNVNLCKSLDELKAKFTKYTTEQRSNLYLIERKNTKSWHDTFPSNFRRIIISTFVGELIPDNERTSILDESEQRLLMLASSSEVIAFQKADSRTEYYNLLGRNIGKIKHRMQHAKEKGEPVIKSSTSDMLLRISKH